MIDEINLSCGNAYNKIQGINLNRNIFSKNDVIIIDNHNQDDSFKDGGTSIDFLIKQRQSESIDQLIIDNLDEKIDVNIEQVLDEYVKLNQ